ncbi:MAG: MoaD/ThiS family protein [Candidatus Aenigmatarchaeota archaeon]|nr:MoaD/ThiS family protein [Nanoarchaeota archaeon]
MKIELKYKGKKSSVSVPAGACVLDAVQKAGINPETVLVRRKKEIIPETEKLNDKDYLEILSVVSGG